MDSAKSITFSRLPVLGHPKTEFNDWKFSFEHWCKINKVPEEEKVEYLTSITEGTARTIVVNCLNKEIPEDYDAILQTLKNHYKKSLP